jgi:hypothetical protein
MAWTEEVLVPEGSQGSVLELLRRFSPRCWPETL